MATRKSVVLFTMILLVLLGYVRPCPAAAPAGDTPVKIAILPFAMHTPGELNYLQSGIRDMLASRLAWQGKVQVIDKSSVDQAVKGMKEVPAGEAIRLGTALKADYVLYGSVTGMGQSLSIDAKMTPVTGNAEPVSFFAQTKNLDDVIPQINNFAQDINQKVFAKPGEKSQTAAAEAEQLATRNPELLLPGALVAGDKISYLNPNFIEVTPEGSIRQPGLWRSQTFQGGILAMDIGDFDRDGKSEIVAMTRNKLTVYKKENQALRVVGTFEGTKVDRFVWVCVVDLHRDGHPLIFLTDMRNRLSSKPDSGNSAIPDPNAREEVSSYVLSLSGGKIQVVADKIPYFLNKVHLGDRGDVLVGQSQGAMTDGAFKGAVYEMQMRSNTLVPAGAVNVPSECNVFNFAKVDLNNDKMDELIVLDNSHRLSILNAVGDPIWKGSALFGSTTNSFEGKVEDRRYNLVDLFWIPSPILLTDLNKDGIPEIVVNRTPTNFSNWLPDSMKSYDKGEIVSLSWDQMSMVENWKTREINGMVTSIRIGDIEGKGKTQLVVSMVLAKDLLKMWDSKSTIFTYDLNVSTAPAKPEGSEKPAPAGSPAQTKSQQSQQPSDSTATSPRGSKKTK